MRVWLLLCLPAFYLLRASVAAAVYFLGTIVWLFAREFAFFVRTPNPMFFWFMFLLAVPYFLFRFFENRDSRETGALAVVMTIALVFGMGFSADFAKSDLGGVAFAGLMTLIYLCGMKFFPRNGERLHIVALLGGIGIGVTAIVLSFESNWHMTREFFLGPRPLGGNISLALQILFPLAAVCLAGVGFLRRNFQFSLSAALFPIVTAIIWGIANLCPPGHSESLYRSNCTFAAAALMNGYVLWLGIDILTRGIRSNSIARTNFGLVLIAALAISRFFDSELSFITRGLGFIVVGAGFLVANIVLFKKRAATAA
jgi:hypothetical protein